MVILSNHKGERKGDLPCQNIIKIMLKMTKMSKTEICKKMLLSVNPPPRKGKSILPGAPILCFQGKSKLAKGQFPLYCDSKEVRN